MGETWEDRGEGIDALTIENRAEAYDTKIDKKILIITAGVDVQLDRLEMEIVGWGNGIESWSLAYVRMPGDPHLVETWRQLDAHIDRVFTRADGVKLRPQTVFVDSGYATQEVYKYCYPRQVKGVFAAKGQPKPGDQLVSLSKKRFRRGLRLFNVATIGAKDKIFAYLTIKKPGPGYCHFPDHYDQEYYSMLTAEQRYTKHVKGVPVRFYRKIRQRNEALDCRVLALAALEKADPKWRYLARRLAKKAELKNNNQPVEKEEAAKQENPMANIIKMRRHGGRRKKGFVHGWK